MKRSFNSIIICLLLSSQLIAQNQQRDNIVGIQHIIQSQSLNEERTVQVYLPPDHDNSEKRYPVLYVLDGQRLFLYAVSLAQSFQQFQITPELIIVGINNSYPSRFTHFGNGRDDFLSFIEKELVPLIDETYSTKNERMLFGWEYGGSLAFHALQSGSTTFDAYFLSSPYPIFDEIDSLTAENVRGKSLYFSVSPDEYEINHALNKLNATLTEKQFEGLIWEDFRYGLEEHRTTAYPTLRNSLIQYFKYYRELESNNIQKFMDAGGMSYAREYNRQRATQYGFPEELSVWSRYTFIRSAIRADNFSHFETLMNELNTNQQLVNDLEEAGRGHAAQELAAFYEKYNQLQSAINIYKVLLKKSPDSSTLLEHIGKAYKALGNDEQAKLYLEKGGRAKR